MNIQRCSPKRKVFGRCPESMVVEVSRGGSVWSCEVRCEMVGEVAV